MHRDASGERIVQLEYAELDGIETTRNGFTKWGLMVAGLLSGFSIAVFIWISRYQSLILDDYSMLRAARNNDIATYLTNYYLGWIGRMVPTLYAYVFLPRPNLFALVNGVVLIGCVLLVIRLGLGRWPRLKPQDLFLTLVVLGTFWFGAPDAHQTLVWRVGAFNYLWVLFPVLLFAVPYRTWLSSPLEERPQKPWVLRSLLMFMAGFLVGLTHEQAVMLLGWLGLWLLVYMIRHKLLAHPPAWLYSGAIGLLIGFVILLAAPGNSVRMSAKTFTSAERLHWFSQWLLGVFGDDWMGAYPWFVLLAVLGLSVTIPRLRTESLTSVAVAWITGAILLLVPLYWTFWATASRATFFSFAAVLVGVVSLMSTSRSAAVYDALTPSAAVAGCLLVAVLLASDAAFEIRPTLEMRSHHDARAAALIRGQGTDQEVVVRGIPLIGRRFQERGEISTDPGSWRNRALAQYYGVTSVRLSE